LGTFNTSRFHVIKHNFGHFAKLIISPEKRKGTFGRKLAWCNREAIADPATMPRKFRSKMPFGREIAL